MKETHSRVAGIHLIIIITSIMGLAFGSNVEASMRTQWYTPEDQGQTRPQGEETTWCESQRERCDASWTPGTTDKRCNRLKADCLECGIRIFEGKLKYRWPAKNKKGGKCEGMTKAEWDEYQERETSNPPPPHPCSYSTAYIEKRGGIEVQVQCP